MLGGAGCNVASRISCSAASRPVDPIPGLPPLPAADAAVVQGVFPFPGQGVMLLQPRADEQIGPFPAGYGDDPPPAPLDERRGGSPMGCGGADP